MIILTINVNLSEYTFILAVAIFTIKWSVINFIHLSNLLQVSSRRLPEISLIAKWPWWLWIKQMKTSAQGRRNMLSFWSNRQTKLAALEARTFPFIERWHSAGVCTWAVSKLFVFLNLGPPVPRRHCSDRWGSGVEHLLGQRADGTLSELWFAQKKVFFSILSRNYD